MPQIMFRMCLLNGLGLFWFIGVVFGEDGWSVCINDDVSFSRHLLLGCCFLILMQPLIEASIPPDAKKGSQSSFPEMFALANSEEQGRKQQANGISPSALRYIKHVNTTLQTPPLPSPSLTSLSPETSTSTPSHHRPASSIHHHHHSPTTQQQKHNSHNHPQAQVYKQFRS